MLKLLTTIVLNVLIFGLLLVFIFLGFKLYSAYKQDDQALDNLVNPTYLLSLIHFGNNEKYVLYTSQSFSFEHPTNWSPKRSDVLNGGGEVIDLEIPFFFNLTKAGAANRIGYSRDDYLRQRPQPSTILYEGDFTMANRKGLKWIYKEKGMYYYKYAIPLVSFYSFGRQVSGFYLQAESTTKDAQLEKQLDHVALSVKFKSEE